MADIIKRLVGPMQPGTTIANVYGPVGAGKVVTIRNIRVTNTTDLNATISISIGASAVDTPASRLVSAANIPGNSVYKDGTNDVLHVGEYITVKVSVATSLTLTISGVESDV